MQVSNKFGKIKDQSALIIASGTKSAKLHVLQNGQINERDSILIETPKYSDNEGFFLEKGADGTVTGSGSVYDNQKDYLSKSFLKTLRGHILNLVGKFDPQRIYLFAPGFFVGQEEDILPRNVFSKVAGVFKGNYAKEAPEKLLVKIEQMYDNEADIGNPPTGDAAKILNTEKRKHGFLES